MPNRLLLSVISLLAVLVAPVAMPAVSEATPHYFRNGGAKIAEGVKVPVIAWGNIELVVGGEETVECRNVVGGYIENPKGGGAGVGATESFNVYRCLPFPQGEGCFDRNAENFVSVQARNANGEHETSSQGPFGSGNQVKWPSVLEEKEREPGVITINSSNVSLLLGCREPSGELVEGGLECFTEPVTHEWARKWTNGSGIGSKPSKTEYSEGSGLNCSGFGNLKIGKSLKVMGYNEEEIIETKNENF